MIKTDFYDENYDHDFQTYPFSALHCFVWRTILKRPMCSGGRVIFKPIPIVLEEN